MYFLDKILYYSSNITLEEKLTMKDERITLEVVDRHFPDGMPLVASPGHPGPTGSLDELLGYVARDTDPLTTAIGFLGDLATALRTGKSTPAQVILLSKGLTVGQIAGQCGLNTKELLPTLEQWEEAGIVRSAIAGNASKMPTFFVPGL